MTVADVVKEYEEFLEKTGIKDVKVAKALGVSTTTFSLFKKGTYRGKNEELAENLLKYMRNYNYKNNEEGEFFETTDAKMALFTMSDAVEDRAIGLVYGEPGTGKTWACKEFVRRRANAVLIEANPHSQAKTVLEDIAEALGLSALPQSIHGKFRAIEKFLEDADKILVVDEAENLPYRALEDIRRIHDFTDTPIILSGTENLLKNLMGKHGELKQLYSRICGKWVMKGLSKDETEKYVGKHIHKWTNGNFRTSKMLNKRANRLAKLDSCNIDEHYVGLATKMIVL